MSIPIDLKSGTLFFVRYKVNQKWLALVQRGREGQATMNPVENLRTLWNGLRTPWKVSEPRGGGFYEENVIKSKYYL